MLIEGDQVNEKMESGRLILPTFESNGRLIGNGAPMRCLNCGFQDFEEVSRSIRFFAMPRGEAGRPIRTEVMEFAKPILQRCLRCLMPVDAETKEKMALTAEKLAAE